MEPNYANFPSKNGNKFSSKSIQAVNSNINVVINNQSIMLNSNININNNILVIQNFNKDSSGDKKQEASSHNEDQAQPIRKKRIDQKGNEIKQAGKQSVVFIDKISKMRFADIIDIESYKEFNVSEPLPSSSSQKNSCCLII